MSSYEADTVVTTKQFEGILVQPTTCAYIWKHVVKTCNTTESNNSFGLAYTVCETLVNSRNGDCALNQTVELTEPSFLENKRYLWLPWLLLATCLPSWVISSVCFLSATNYEKRQNQHDRFINSTIRALSSFERELQNTRRRYMDDESHYVRAEAVSVLDEVYVGAVIV